MTPNFPKLFGGKHGEIYKFNNTTYREEDNVPIDETEEGTVDGLQVLIDKKLRITQWLHYQISPN